MLQHALLLTYNGEASSEFRQALRSNDVALTEEQSFEKVRGWLLAGHYRHLLIRCDTVSSRHCELLRFIREKRIAVDAIVIPKRSEIGDAVEAMKAGAADLIIAGELDEDLADSIAARLRRGEPVVPPPDRRQQASPGESSILIGKSPAIEDVRAAIDLVAPSTTPVLITGESGTGKEVVARMVHMRSARADRPFIAVNCAAMPKDVIENELFGHERGAFTGATDKKAGCFELAHGGTLFFDEIAEMSTEIQAKLLRVLESKAFRRLGGKDEVRVDVRALAATNKKMTEALRAGEFRKDLYFRFSVIEIDLVPLRERREDIVLLAEHFLTELGRQYRKNKQRFSAECLELFQAYDWPGNIRELRNTVERAVVICHDDVITEKSLPARLTMVRTVGRTITLPIGITAREAERRFILQTLAAEKNNKSRTAQILGVSRKTLHNKLKEFEV